MLCEVCITTLRRARERAYTNNHIMIGTRQETVGHHTSFVSLDASAADGCFACHRLWATIDPGHRPLLRDVIDAQWAEARVQPGFYVTPKKKRRRGSGSGSGSGSTRSTASSIDVVRLDESYTEVPPDWELVPVVPPFRPDHERPPGLGDEHAKAKNPLDGYVTTFRVWYSRNCDRIELWLGPKYRNLSVDGVNIFGNTMKVYHLFMGSAAAEDSKTWVMKPFTSTTTNSDESFAQASAWIQNCISTHQDCNAEAKAGSDWYPTRLIDVGATSSPADPEADSVRLVVTQEDPSAKGDRYVTLSHCWGTAQFLQLKKSNLAVFRREGGIETRRLSRTFRDAVVATRRLGVRYLWIDSLCICQDRDDLSDWLVEAGSMQKVYSHSLCNLSATGSPAVGEGGLFAGRNPEISVNTARLRAGDLGLRLRSSSSSSSSGDGHDDDLVPCKIVDMAIWSDIESSRINTRGWVFQERILAPRILHFGRSELMWECREHAAVESHPEILPDEDGDRGDIQPKLKQIVSHVMSGRSLAEAKAKAKTKADTTGGDSDLDPLLDAYGFWQWIVSTYFPMRLTVSSDRLVALSGIASKFGSAVLELGDGDGNSDSDDGGNGYVAGMWRKHLEPQMLWHNDGRAVARPPEYRAPSWSWASIDGTDIGWACCTSDNELAIEVVDVHVELAAAAPGAAASPTGPVRSGSYLDLECHLWPVFLAPGTPYEDPTRHQVRFQWHRPRAGLGVSVVRIGGGGGAGYSSSSELESDSILKIGGWAPWDPNSYDHETKVYLDADEGDVHRGGSLYCVPAQAPPDARNCEEGGYGVYLLLVLEDGAEGTYRRVGLVEAGNREDFEALTSPQDTDASVACLSFVDGWHTIRVL